MLSISRKTIATSEGADRKAPGRILESPSTYENYLGSIKLSENKNLEIYIYKYNVKKNNTRSRIII